MHEDKAEWLDEIEKEDSSLKAMVEESIGERESKKFVEGLNSKHSGKEVQFKKYLRGLSDAGTRSFKSGTHGLNEELGRHRGREGKEECVLCGDECKIHCGIVQY